MTRDRRIFVTNVESPAPPRPINQPSWIRLALAVTLLVTGAMLLDAGGWVSTLAGVVVGFGITASCAYLHDTIRWLKLGRS